MMESNTTRQHKIQPIVNTDFKFDKLIKDTKYCK